MILGTWYLMAKENPQNNLVNQIDWESYLTNYELDAIDVFVEWAEENIVIVQDEQNRTEYVTIDRVPDTWDDIVNGDITFVADDAVFLKEEYECKHCAGQFSNIHYWIKHAISYLNRNGLLKIGTFLTTQNFFQLLRDYVLQDDNALLATAVQFITQNDERLDLFIDFLHDANIIPPEIYHKYLEFEEY